MIGPCLGGRHSVGSRNSARGFATSFRWIPDHVTRVPRTRSGMTESRSLSPSGEQNLPTSLRRKPELSPWLRQAMRWIPDHVTRLPTSTVRDDVALSLFIPSFRRKPESRADKKGVPGPAPRGGARAAGPGTRCSLWEEHPPVSADLKDAMGGITPRARNRRRASGVRRGAGAGATHTSRQVNGGVSRLPIYRNNGNYQP